MPRAESEQRMTAGSGTLRARAPGQTPSVPTPLAGAAATSAVAVPWRSVSGWPASDVMFGPRSGWVGSSWESTSAISGLLGPTGGGTWPPTTWSRHQASGESGSSAGRLRPAAEPVGLGIREQPARPQCGGEPSGPPARDEPRAARDRLGAVGAGDPRRGARPRADADDPGPPVRLGRGRRGVARQHDPGRRDGVAGRGAAARHGRGAPAPERGERRGGGRRARRVSSGPWAAPGSR